MKVSVTFQENVYSLDISEDLEVENLKALLEFESGIPAAELAIYYNGVHLTDLKKSLKDYGIKEGEILIMVKNSPTTSNVGTIDWSSIRVPNSRMHQPLSRVDPVVLREMLMADTYQRAVLRERNPPLSAALESGNLQKFIAVFEQQKKSREEQEELRQRMIRADPFDLEAQQKIAEEIQQKNINANMETAMEFSPESFGQVTMLYINCRVNGQPVKAFVDSGAQMTIMSVACAERCNIMRLVDRRWAGIAKGVGTQKIIGRVHVAQIQIEKDFLASSFSVLESQPMDVLLGLDMLKRHQCSIDLKSNVLRIGTTGTETAFLAESDLPECARLSADNREDRELAEALTRSEQDASSIASHSSSQSMPPSNVSQMDIQRLIDMGFKREDIVQELAKNGGDVEKTTAVLLARSLTFKP